MEVLNHLPEGTILVGEIYYPGKRSKDVTPIMGSLPEKAIERQNGEYGLLHYYIHDILRYRNTDLISYGASIRYNILKAVYNKLFSLEKVDFIELAERVDENIQEFVADALARGEEGAVLKKKTAPYTPGKRPAWDTIKIKKTDTCDAVCMGFSDPTKYYNGKLDVGPNYTGKDAKEWPYWVIEQRDSIFPEDSKIVSEKTVPIGQTEIIRSPLYGTVPVTKAYYHGWKTSMDVGAYDDNGTLVKIGSVSSGLNEDIQRIAGSNPELYIGEVVELAGMEKNHEDKTLRHFYFKNFRDDKNPKDCKISEIF
jgi:ATP-dependent DNA ligase